MNENTMTKSFTDASKAKKIIRYQDITRTITVKCS